MQSTITVYVPLEMIPDGAKVRKAHDGYEYLVKSEVVLYNKKKEKTIVNGEGGVKYLFSNNGYISAEPFTKKVFYEADFNFIAKHLYHFDEEV